MARIEGWTKTSDGKVRRWKNNTNGDVVEVFYDRYIRLWSVSVVTKSSILDAGDYRTKEEAFNRAYAYMWALPRGRP